MKTKGCQILSLSLASLLLTAILSAPVPLQAGADPWEWDTLGDRTAGGPPRTAPALKPVNALKVFFLGGIRFYQKHLSWRRDGRCPSWPSCSRFGYEAIQRYGIMGIFIAVDRLYYRENDDEDHFYGVIETPDGYRFYDPVSNNWIFDKSNWRLEP